MNTYVFTVDIYSADCVHTHAIELVAEFSFTPFIKGAKDEHGQPLEPDEPECFDIGEITPNNSNPSVLEMTLAEHFNTLGDYDQLIETIRNDDISWGVKP
jgi:hypothetical protein